MSRPSIIEYPIIYFAGYIYNELPFDVLTKFKTITTTLLFSKCAEPGSYECKKASNIHYTLIPNKMLCSEWAEIDHRLDVCRVKNGGHIGRFVF